MADESEWESSYWVLVDEALRILGVSDGSTSGWLRKSVEKKPAHERALFFNAEPLDIASDIADVRVLVSHEEKYFEFRSALLESISERLSVIDSIGDKAKGVPFLVDWAVSYYIVLTGGGQATKEEMLRAMLEEYQEKLRIRGRSAANLDLVMFTMLGTPAFLSIRWASIKRKYKKYMKRF